MKPPRKPFRPGKRIGKFVTQPLCCGLAASLGATTGLAQIGFMDQGIPAGALSPRPGLHLGRFEFHGGIQTTVTYDDLVQITTNGPQSDLSWTLAPFVSAETRGPNDRYVRAYYRPGFLFFTDNTDLNSINHAANFDLRFPLNRLTLSLAENVAVASVVVRDIGNRATQMNFSTIGTADYEYSERTSFQGVLTYDHFGYQGEVEGAKNLGSSDQFGQQVWTDYHWGAKLSAGVGVAVSEVKVENGTSQTAEAPELRLYFNPSPDFSLRGAVGVQFRQFDSDQAGTVEPVLRLTSTYRPRPGTTLSLEAHRAEMASGLNSGQNFVDTGFTATINQVFLRRFSASLGGGYTMADYVATEAGVTADRTDSYYSVRTALNWNVRETVGLGLFFEHTGNNSDTQTFTYDHNVVGLQATWSF